MKTIAPYTADSDSRLRISALIGMTRLPVIRNSSSRVAPAMTATAIGSRSLIAALVSTSWAEGPPTSTPNGAGSARTRSTRFSPALEYASTVGTTRSQVAPPATNRAAGEAAGHGVHAGDAGEPGEGGGVAVDLGRAGGRSARVGRHHLERRGVPGGEVVADRVGDLAAAGGGRQHPVVRQAEAHAEEGRTQYQQHRHHRERDRDRPPHHRHGDPVPRPGPGARRPGSRTGGRPG